MNEIIFRSDEPTIEDRLDRTQYSKAFARLAETSDTPLVIGLYGRWGVGKTSLMKLIEHNLDSEKAQGIWFNPWEHQFDESPVLALMHTVVDKLKIGEEGKKLLTVIASAFGSMLLKATTNLTLKEVDELGKRYEEELFQVREARVRLRNHFKNIIEKAQGIKGRRIVFFIDDLDRCMPSQTLNMLESLKLYLSLPGCVYFIGVDRSALERSIQHHYGDLGLSEHDYIDKIVQLPFSIPQINRRSMEEFVTSLLPDELKDCKALLVEGLGNNPRQVIRFINTLNLNHQLALGSEIPSYSPSITAILLLIQYRSPDLYRQIAGNPILLQMLKQRSEEAKTIVEEYLERDKGLKTLIDMVDIPDGTSFERYVYLSKAAWLSEEAELNLGEIISEHELWLATEGKMGRRANLIGADLTRADLSKLNFEFAELKNANLSGAKLCNANLINADLRGCTLRGADLTMVDLRNAKLSGASFSGIEYSHLWPSEATLAFAKLSKSDLSRANLSKLDLCRLDLSEANLCEANLSETDLQGANLQGANLEGTKLLGAKNLSAEQLSKTETIHNAQLDENLRKEMAEKHPERLDKPKNVECT